MPGKALGFAAAFIRKRRSRPLRKHHLRLNHHCGKLSVRAVYRGLYDDHAPPHMDRHSNSGQPPWHAGAKDIRLRFDRGCPKPRTDVESRQSSAEIIGERRQRTAMHMAAVVEMTSSTSSSPTGLSLSASVMRMPKCSGIPERAGVEVIAEHQFA